MQSEDTQSKGRVLLPVTLAIISVVGSIVVALITKWPFGSTDLKPIAVDTMIIQPKPNPDDLSFCDKLKLAIADVPLKFINFKGAMTQETTNEIIYQTNYVFDNVESGIIYDKQDKTYLLELQPYVGVDSIKALHIMSSYISILDACLTTKNKQKLYKSKDERMFSQEYLDSNYKVEIQTIILSSDTITVDIDIGHNDE